MANPELADRLMVKSRSGYLESNFIHLESNYGYVPTISPSGQNDTREGIPIPIRVHSRTNPINCRNDLLWFTRLTHPIRGRAKIFIIGRIVT